MHPTLILIATVLVVLALLLCVGILAFTYYTLINTGARQTKPKDAIKPPTSFDWGHVTEFKR